MPYKYIGRTLDFKGKTLWELVGNLKNFGVGRLVIRHMKQRYPEPCYMRILKVETLPAPEKETHDDKRLVRVWMQDTFRGITSPEPMIIEPASYKADFQLIPKDREVEFLTDDKVYKFNKVLPRTMRFPPILEELLRRESNSDEIPQLEIVYNKDSREKRYRIAEEGEKPTMEFGGFERTACPQLYEGLKPI